MYYERYRKKLIVIEVALKSLRMDVQSSTPVVLLSEIGGLERTLPIFIGPPEATAIAMIIQEIEAPRPMTHDLLLKSVEALQGRLERVLITELKDRIFLAELIIKNPVGDDLTVSARPSDAIALALRSEVKIFVNDDLMEQEGLFLPSSAFEDDDSGDSADEILGEFKEFLDTLKPEDFSS